MAHTPRGWVDTLASWLFAPCSDDKDTGGGCCGSGGQMREGGRRPREVLNRAASEKRPYQIHYDQPRPTSPIRAGPRSRSASRGGRLQKGGSNSRKHRRGNDEGGPGMGWMDRNVRTGKRKSTRRPQISNPFNFHHTSSGAVDFSTTSGPRSAPLFRPLELTIHEGNNRVSPLLPYFAGSSNEEPSRSRYQARTPPNQIRGLPDVFDDDDATTLAHSRSYSDLSFHIPRRPVQGDGASFTTSSYDSPPRIPPRAAGRRMRPRAYTSPSVERIVERIASAMIEKEMLDAEIESVKERASICLSRPSTAYFDPGKFLKFPREAGSNTRGTDHDTADEPIPEFPIVPPTAPSFAERVSIDRPRTAPATQSAFEPPPPPPPPRQFTDPVQKESQQQPVRQGKPRQQPPVSYTPTTPLETPLSAVCASAFNSHPPDASPKIIDNSRDIDVPLAPPLPLILRPPLRKKKSFSRVSDWLFPAGVENHHSDPMSSPTATTTPIDQPPPSLVAPKRKGNGKHDRQLSLDSVTNTPRALTDRDGFYQTLPPSAIFSGRRGSYDSMSDVTHAHTNSVYSTDEDGEGNPATVATSEQWSPGCTPPETARRGESGKCEVMIPPRRRGTGGSSSAARSPVERLAGGEVRVAIPPRAAARSGVGAVQGPRPTSVGVAF